MTAGITPELREETSVRFGGGLPPSRLRHDEVELGGQARNSRE